MHICIHTCILEPVGGVLLQFVTAQWPEHIWIKHVYIHVYIHIHVGIQEYQIPMHTHLSLEVLSGNSSYCSTTRKYIYIYIHIYVYLHTHIYTYTHKYIYIYLYSCIYVGVNIYQIPTHTYLSLDVLCGKSSWLINGLDTCMLFFLHLLQEGPSLLPTLLVYICMLEWGCVCVCVCVCVRESECVCVCLCVCVCCSRCCSMCCRMCCRMCCSDLKARRIGDANHMAPVVCVLCVAVCVAVTSKRGASGTQIIWLRLCVCCVLQYMLQYVLQWPQSAAHRGRESYGSGCCPSTTPVNKPWHTYEPVTSHLSMSHVQWVMSHIWTSHIAHMNGSCHKYGSAWCPSHILLCKYGSDVM